MNADDLITSAVRLAQRAFPRAKNHRVVVYPFDGGWGAGLEYMPLLETTWHSWLPEWVQPSGTPTAALHRLVRHAETRL